MTERIWVPSDDRLETTRPSSTMLWPVDEMTGIPYSLYPNADIPPAPTGRDRNLEIIGNWHHIFYPKPEFIGHGLAREGLRGGRVQWVSVEEHGEGHATYIKPPIPPTPLGQFKTSTFLAADYVPPLAVAFGKDGSPTEVELSLEQRVQLIRSGAIRISDHSKLRQSLFDYAVSHGLMAGSEYFDELLHTQNRMRKMEIAEKLIKRVCEVSTSPFSADYIQAWESHSLAQNAPNPGELVASFAALRSRLRGKTVDRLQRFVRAAIKEQAQDNVAALTVAGA